MQEEPAILFVSISYFVHDPGGLAFFFLPQPEKALLVQSVKSAHSDRQRVRQRVGKAPVDGDLLNLLVSKSLEEA